MCVRGSTALPFISPSEFIVPPPHKKYKQETFEVTNINTLHNDKLGHMANDTDSPPAPKKNATQNNMANVKLT